MQGVGGKCELCDRAGEITTVKSGFVGGKCEICDRAGGTATVKSDIVGGKCEKNALSGDFFGNIVVKGVRNVKVADALQQGSAAEAGERRYWRLWKKSSPRGCCRTHFPPSRKNKIGEGHKVNNIFADWKILEMT